MIADVVYSTVLRALSCATCHIAFAVPDNFMSARRADHQGFCCPSGHKNYYSQQSESERLKTELEREQQRYATACRDADHQREQRQAEERRVRSLKGVITRTKRRVAHGVCPCCNRTFKDLARHMDGQHPDYVKTAAEAPTAS